MLVNQWVNARSIAVRMLVAMPLSYPILSYPYLAKIIALLRKPLKGVSA